MFPGPFPPPYVLIRLFGMERLQCLARVTRLRNGYNLLDHHFSFSFLIFCEVGFFFFFLIPPRTFFWNLQVKWVLGSAQRKYAQVVRFEAVVFIYFVLLLMPLGKQTDSKRDFVRVGKTWVINYEASVLTRLELCCQSEREFGDVDVFVLRR